MADLVELNFLEKTLSEFLAYFNKNVMHSLKHIIFILLFFPLWIIVSNLSVVTIHLARRALFGRNVGQLEGKFSTEAKWF